MVVSGAPGTRTSSVAAGLAHALGRPLLSRDVVKEALADSLGLGDECWSSRLRDGAAEVIFTLAEPEPEPILEGLVAAGEAVPGHRELPGRSRGLLPL